MSADYLSQNIENNIIEKSQHQERAIEGDINAMLSLGLIYQNESNFLLAFDWYSRAADLGNAVAMCNLGWFYQQGLGVTVNYEKSIEWYRWAANAGNAGNAVAMFSLGLFYQQGFGVEVDDAQAFKWYKQAADVGNAIAMHSVGLCYQQGVGVDVDPEQAFGWFKKAAVAGNAIAMLDIGVCYQQGIGVGVDNEQAVAWFKRGAEAGNAAAMCHLGWCYHQGIGVSLDYIHAIEWHKRAAEAGNAVAMHNLGWIYQQGLGVPEDNILALEWYKRAADAGNAISMCHLGWVYQQGAGVKVDYAQALRWYKQSAFAGNSIAMHSVGWFYQQGLGVLVNYTIALEWYSQAADAGNSLSMFNVGWFYQQGYGVAVNNVIALEWYKRAADADNLGAIHSVGLFYHYGLGVTVDYEKALEWYTRAAEAGNSFSMYELGRFYQQGTGGKRDLEKARFYWTKAASMGLETAWVDLVKLDYMDDSAVEVDNIAEECDNEVFKNWKSWSSNDETALLSLPTPPSWLEKYIELALMTQGGTIENEEFWHILAIIRLFAQQQQAKHLITKNTFLYHFTRFEVLEKFLPNPDLDSSYRSKNVLRCYHVSYMNDPSEGRRLLDFHKKINFQNSPSAIKGSERLRFWFESEECGSYFHQLDNAHVVSNIPASVFTVSFTQRPDSLDLWRAYGDNGQGISIGFPIVGTNNLYLKSTPIMASSSQQSLNLENNTINGTLEPIIHVNPAPEQDFEVRYYEVAYGDSEVADALSIFTPLLDRLDKVIANSEDGKTLTEIARTHITESLLHILYLFKDEAYSSEKEVRAIRIYPLHHDSVRRDERSPRRLYCELKNCSLFTTTGTQIIIGPRVDDSNAMIWDARHLLTLHGYDRNVMVKRSEVKYR